MDETIVVIVRSIITFFSLLIYARVLGKQQMGNLSFFDYINGITIGSIGGALATDLSTKAWVHWVGLTTFITIAFALQLISLKNHSLAKVIASDPIIVIQEGKILEENLKTIRVTKDELFVLLRQKDIFDITKVQYALMEPNGKMSVLIKSEYQTVTSHELHLPSSTTGLSTDVIYDGLIMQENLQKRNKDVHWLLDELKKQGIAKVNQVAYAALMPNNTLYVDLFNDRIVDDQNLNNEGN